MALPRFRKSFLELHVNWGHAPAERIRRALADSGGDNFHSLRHVDEVLGLCEVCRAFGRILLLPLAVPATVSMFNENSQVGLSFPARSKNPREVWDVCSSSRIGILEPPMCIRMDEGDERQSEIWADFCSAPRIRPLCRGVGAQPRILERRDDLD